MQSEINPYESPIVAGVEAPVMDLRRPAMGTFLIVFWVLEGGLKASLLAAGLVHGFNPLLALAEQYRSWQPLWFFLAVTFLIVETIGPWIGIYYLTGRRARTIPFEPALVRTLIAALGIALVATLLLMLYCELAGPDARSPGAQKRLRGKPQPFSSSARDRT